MRLWLAVLVVQVVVLGGCSTVVEDQQMPGMDFRRFTLGERRIDIIKVLGPPATSAKDGANSCDLYRYAHTVSRAGQGAINVGETAGNFFTFGLFGAMAMPAEDAMKGKKREAWFCYAADERLVSMTDQVQASRAPSTPKPVTPR